MGDGSQSKVTNRIAEGGSRKMSQRLYGGWAVTHNALYAGGMFVRLLGRRAVTS